MSSPLRVGSAMLPLAMTPTPVAPLTLDSHGHEDSLMHDDTTAFDTPNAYPTPNEEARASPSSANEFAFASYASYPTPASSSSKPMSITCLEDVLVASASTPDSVRLTPFVVPAVLPLVHASPFGDRSTSLPGLVTSPSSSLSLEPDSSLTRRSPIATAATTEGINSLTRLEFPYLVPSPLSRSDAESSGSTTAATTRVVDEFNTSGGGGGITSATNSPFRSSSFFTDAVASPNTGDGATLASVASSFENESSASQGLQWSHMRRRDAADEDEDVEEEEQEAPELPLEASAHLTDGGIGSIGDISMSASSTASSTDPPTTGYYHSMLLQEDFAGVRMHDELSSTPGEVPERRSSDSKPSVRRKPLAIATKWNTLPSTPVTRPRRLAARRNSEVISTAAASQFAKAAAAGPTAPSSIAPAAGTLRVGLSAISLPPTTGLSGTTGMAPAKVSHKRKSVCEKTDGGSGGASSTVNECELCSTCSDCAKHFADLVDRTHVKHDSAHGHVHPRPTVVLVTGPEEVSGVPNHVPMMTSPSHATTMGHLPPVAPLIKSTPSSTTTAAAATRNFLTVGDHACCRANHAVRSGPSINDSYTSLALSPALSSRRLHHKMLHGHAYEVAELLDVRLRDGAVYYLVAWQGYPDMFNSWEPASSLDKNCSDKIEAFEEERGKLEADYDDDDDDDDSQRLHQESDEEHHHAVADLKRMRSAEETEDEEDEDLDAINASTSPRPTNFAPRTTTTAAAHTHAHAHHILRPMPPRQRV